MRLADCSLILFVFLMESFTPSFRLFLRADFNRLFIALCVCIWDSWQQQSADTFPKLSVFLLPDSLHLLKHNKHENISNALTQNTYPGDNEMVPESCLKLLA